MGSFTVQLSSILYYNYGTMQYAVNDQAAAKKMNFRFVNDILPNFNYQSPEP
jgi:hypothetical protein